MAAMPLALLRSVRARLALWLALLIKPQETRRIVVEDIALLRSSQEVSRFDSFDSDANDLRPHGCVRAEHDPLAKASLHQTSQVAMKLFARQSPVNPGQFHVNLRIKRKQGNHFVQHRPAGMHDIEAQLRVAVQHLLEQKRIIQCRSIPRSKM